MNERKIKWNYGLLLAIVSLFHCHFLFQRREDWSILTRLPINKQNTIHIRLEDEGPYGNDETRCFVLSHFSSLGIRELECVFCSCKLVVYDRFPLVDGTLFISPFVYDEKRAVPAMVSNRSQFMHAVCLGCMSGSNGIKCKFCERPWSTGSSLQIGEFYGVQFWKNENSYSKTCHSNDYNFYSGNFIKYNILLWKNLFI